MPPGAGRMPHGAVLASREKREVSQGSMMMMRTSTMTTPHDRDRAVQNNGMMPRGYDNDEMVLRNNEVLARGDDEEVMLGSNEVLPPAGDSEVVLQDEDKRPQEKMMLPPRPRKR